MRKIEPEIHQIHHPIRPNADSMAPDHNRSLPNANPMVSNEDPMTPNDDSMAPNGVTMLPNDYQMEIIKQSTRYIGGQKVKYTSCISFPRGAWERDEDRLGMRPPATLSGEEIRLLSGFFVGTLDYCTIFIQIKVEAGANAEESVV